MLDGLRDQTLKIESSTTAVTELSASIQQVASNAVEATKVAEKSNVAVGAAVSPSPTGAFKIVNRIPRPTYYHPGKVIGPGKSNPLGTRWLGLSIKGFGIHGTNVPRSIGRAASHGTSYAQSWGDVAFQRMPNVNLLPGTKALSLADLIADTEDAILITGRSSYSIDHQRYNFQFGGAVYRAPQDGFSFYGAYGSLFVLLPDDDAAGGRVFDPFDAAVERHPNHPAIVYLGERFTYSRLRDLIDRFSTALDDLGVRRGHRAVVYLGNSPQWIIAYLGLQKIGAIPVPTNTLLTPRDLTYILRDSRAKAIVVSAPLLQKVLARRDSGSVCLRRFALMVAAQQRGAEATNLLLTSARSDPDQEVRTQAVFWLSQTDDPRVVPVLDSVMRTSTDEEVQSAALFAISQQRNTAARQLLRRRLRARGRPRRVHEDHDLMGSQGAGEVSGDDGPEPRSRGVDEECVEAAPGGDAAARQDGRGRIEVEAPQVRVESRGAVGAARRGGAEIPRGLLGGGVRRRGEAGNREPQGEGRAARAHDRRRSRVRHVLPRVLRPQLRRAPGRFRRS